MMREILVNYNLMFLNFRFSIFLGFVRRVYYIMFRKVCFDLDNELERMYDFFLGFFL